MPRQGGGRRKTKTRVEENKKPRQGRKKPRQRGKNLNNAV